MSHKHHSILIVISATLLLLLISQAVADTYQGLIFGRWPDLQMTYALNSNCSTDTTRILRAMDYWVKYLPGLTWTETSLDNARMVFDCTAPLMATCYGDHQDWTPMVFTMCLIGIYPNIFVVIHEIGHGFGLIDGTGGIMGPDLTSNLDPDFGVPQPTPAQLTALGILYGFTPIVTTTTSASATTSTATTTSSAQTLAGSPQTITVVVSKDGRWIADAEVTLNGVGTLHTTGDPAVATFTNNPPGTYTVTANNGEYQNTVTVTVSTMPIFVTVPLDNAMPIPEFPTPMIMFLIVLGALVMIRRNRRLKSSL